MSKRSILNTTSQKKRDKMLTWTNITAATPFGSTTYLAAPAILAGNTPLYVIPWCSTARDATTNLAGNKPNKFDQATRTASSCYMVGLKESIEVQCADGLPWQWRRLCFTFKGGLTLNTFLPSSTTPGFSAATEISQGYVRPLNALTASQYAILFQLLFQGTVANDWTDPMTAKLDAERISIKYDKTVTIASGNEQGVIRKYNRWHGMRHNLQYDDDESGGSMATGTTSVESKIGMGDYWVIDIIKPRMSATSTNQLSFNCESTLYWHER